eukprot:345136-Rhodomonas_salina.1
MGRTPPIVLRRSYGMSGTDAAYAATSGLYMWGNPAGGVLGLGEGSVGESLVLAAIVLRSQYAEPGTDSAYAATAGYGALAYARGWIRRTVVDLACGHTHTCCAAGGNYHPTRSLSIILRTPYLSSYALPSYLPTRCLRHVRYSHAVRSYQAKRMSGVVVSSLVLSPPTALRTPYAMSGTQIRYAPTRRRIGPMWRGGGRMASWCAPLSAYARATRCP